VKITTTLGLVAVAALALAVLLGAGTASAATFNSELEETTWKGVVSGERHELALPHAGTFKCENASFAGMTKEKSVAQLEVSPELSQCEFHGFGGFSWSPGGCGYRFHANGEVDIASIPGRNCATEPMSSSYTGCKITIGAQNGIGTVQYYNEGSGAESVVRAVANLQKIKYSETGACGETGTFSDGTYKGEWLITGGKVAWTFSGVTKAPESISGTQLNQQVLTAAGKGYALKCNEVAFSGSQATYQAETLTIVPSYTGCTFLGLNTTVQMKACDYVLHATGTVDIGSVSGKSCEAEPITYKVTGCEIKIGPQSLSKVNYSNEGSGESTAVKVGFELSGLTYTSKGAACEQKGTFSDGTYKGEVKLTAPGAGLSWGEHFFPRTAISVK
jgi:hypothetical protein